MIINKKDTSWYVRKWSHKKADSGASAKWKNVKGKPDKINELILRSKGELKEGLDNIQ